MWQGGGGGGLLWTMYEMVWSTMSTFFAWNLMKMMNQQPDELYNLLVRAKAWWYREVCITIPEDGRDWYTNRVFCAIETYLGTMAPDQVSRLRASAEGSSRNLVFSMDDAEHVVDSFLSGSNEAKNGNGSKKTIAVKWKYHYREPPKGSLLRKPERFYTLTFKAKHRQQVVKEYLGQVMEVSREIESRNRTRKLYTNSMGGDRLWTSVAFKHPAKFKSLAMDPAKKQEIMDDLDKFSKSQDYYTKIGKAWKRGYLLYGPPGTGKSTMIAAMANFLDYDVYDLELTAVTDNTELRRLIVNTNSKSIIVIEDIDCSLDIVGSRSKAESTAAKVKDNDDDKASRKGNKKKEKRSKVTLSGLLNFIDGLWSACGGERLLVFTTNNVEKLDPALIRRGRMDMHIEMSYCGYEAFKLLANNYLDIDEHPLFDVIEGLLKEVKITPADVAEQLMPKNIREEDKARRCLDDLVQALEKAKAEQEQQRQQEEAKTEKGAQESV